MYTENFGLDPVPFRRLLFARTGDINDFRQQRNSFWPWLECVDSYDSTDISGNVF